MKNTKQKKFRKSRIEQVLALVRAEEGYTYPDLAYRLYKEINSFSLKQVYSVVGSLRKKGFLIGPRRNGQEIIIPSSAQDFMDLNYHQIIETGLPTKLKNAFRGLQEGSERFPRISKNSQELLNAIVKPIYKKKITLLLSSKKYGNKKHSNK